MAASEDRGALNGLEERLFKLVSKKATSAQWAEWLRVPLEHAVAEGDRALASSLLRAGANAGAGWKGCDGRTLLDAAAEGGNTHVVSDLLKVGGLTDLNAVSGAKEMTPLLRACKGGHPAAAYTLLFEGAEVNVVDSDRRSALHYALRGGHKELAGNVLIAGANVHAKDHAGDTPLHLAAALEDDMLVLALLVRGVDVDATNTNGQCALHLAVEHNRISSAEALLKARADPNVRCTRDTFPNRCSPLFLARHNSAMTKLLLRHGADVKSRDNLGYTALHWAAVDGPGVIDTLVEGGADLEARSSRFRFNTYRCKGFTPLHSATFNRRSMTALLHKGANINARDDNGLTPLHVVCKTAAKTTSAHKVAGILLRRGADETITDNDGHTPKDLIESGGDRAERLHRLLASAPADRRWRRRGMLVLCRARSTKGLGGVGDGEAGKVLREEKEDGVGADAGDSGCVLSRAAGLETEELFRTIVMFL